MSSINWGSVLLLSLCHGASGQTPIVRDGSTPGRVFGNSTIKIQGGQLSGDKANLFHNFSRFNIPGNKTAVFQHDSAGIRNIIARVTGKEKSIIGGGLSTELGPTGDGRANVFLLNPNGVLFNGNSSIDLNALVVSTANTIGFSDGATVTRDSSTAELENVKGDPIHFGSLDGIGTVNFDKGRVIMTGDGDLLFIAKDVELINGSQITTEGSQVVVAGAGAGNSVTFDISDRGQLPVLGQPATGKVKLEGFSTISTSHEAGGRIVVRGGVITLINSNPDSGASLSVSGAGGDPGVGIDVEATQSLTLTRSQITAGTSPEGTASDIRIRAPMILMDNEAVGVNDSSIRTSGRGGDIGIVTTSLTIRDGEISTNVKGGGKGGSVTINANQVAIRDGGISTNLEGGGAGGSMTVKADQLTIRDGEISTTVVDGGRGGSMIVKADQLTIRDGKISTNVEGGGTGASMNVKADQLTITDRSSIQSVAETSGNGGNIKVAIEGDLYIDGKGATGIDREGMRIPETVGITANTLGTGRGGEISVDVGGDITLTNGGLIDSTTFSDGNAGQINVKSNNLTIDGKGFEFATGITGFTVNQTSPTAGQGGDIEVNVRGDIQIVNGGELDTSSFGAGDAGRVSINRGLSDLSGSIVIDKGTATRFTGIGSDASGGGNAGKVTVRTDTLSVFNGGLISTGVFFQPVTDGMGNVIPANPGTGRGGDIRVFTNTLRISGISLGVDDGTSIVTNSAIFAGTQAGSSGAGGGVFIKPLDESGGMASPSIQLSNRAQIGAGTGGIGDGGSVRIRFSKGLINLDSSSSISARSDKLGGEAGSVNLVAKGITLRNGSSVSSTNGSSPDVGGDAGSVTVMAENLLMDDGSLKVSSSGGNAGTVSILGSGLLDFRSSRVLANAYLEGGNISIKQASSLILTGSRLSANSKTLNGGKLAIRDVGMLDSRTSKVLANASLDGGSISITGSSSLSLNESRLSAKSKNSDGGTVTIHRNEKLNFRSSQVVADAFRGGGSISIRDSSYLSLDESRLAANSDKGNGGTVTIHRNGQLEFKDSQVVANAPRGGGNISIKGLGALSLEGSLLSANSEEGNGGNVSISGRDVLYFQNSMVLADASLGGGKILIERASSLSLDESRLSAKSRKGNGGTVSILGVEFVDFQDGRVVAEAKLDGGNIYIKNARYVLLDQSVLNANAKKGTGGNIGLNAGVILKNTSKITASSEFGEDGIVRIDPQAALSGAEGQKELNPLDVTDSLQPECTNRLATAAGSFIRAGRGGTARLPGGYLPSLRLHRSR
jgi:filamentous hemagglutinin family protein